MSKKKESTCRTPEKRRGNNNNNRARGVSESNTNNNPDKVNNTRSMTVNNAKAQVNSSLQNNPSGSPQIKNLRYCGSYEEWKKRNHLPENQKVFIIIGGYRDFRAALTERGWVENPDSFSPYFDFKWCSKVRDIDYTNLSDNQIVNHFEKNSIITTKCGLAKQLKNIKWYQKVSGDDFYPVCYCLNEDYGIEEFREDFRQYKAASILKIHTNALKKNIDTYYESFSVLYFIRLIMAYMCVNKLLIDYDEIIDKPDAINKCVTDLEWKILEVPKKTQAEIVLEMWGKIPINAYKILYEQSFINEISKEIKEYKESQQLNMDFINELTARINNLLVECAKRNKQFNFVDEQNLWIQKPAGLSRGRGIEVYNNYQKIIDKVENKRKIQWVVQKYIENPLLVKRRKFDIRQWVIITDWNPLTIWFYEDSYVRFAAVDYNELDFENKYIHLTNNCVSSKMKEQEGSYKEDEFFTENLWHSDTFRDYLHEKEGYDVWTEKVKPMIKDVTLWSISSAQDMIENRKGSVELYGMDLMLDEDYNVWLLEINASPSQEYSTKVTAQMVHDQSHDSVQLQVDDKAGKKTRFADSGKFSCLHRAKQLVEKPMFYLNINQTVDGVKIKNLKNV